MTKDGSTFNFDHKRRSLIEYLKVKMDEGDWHAVSDAANDLRVLEAVHSNPSIVIPEGSPMLERIHATSCEQLHPAQPIERSERK